jgi:crotonobetainyl-CoA:carnitine CoA-transferase CaiB-like acyl-CoA transferase
MTDVLAGVKVLEVSQYAFVPAAGASLADWGADVVKVVHPEYGDVMYTAHAAGLPPLEDGTAFMWEVANRNKRSIGLDVATDEGREVLYDMARGADVFLTNFLAPARRRLRIDVDHIRAVNPSIIYARGTGQGPKGPDRDAGGFDSVSFWSRSGWANPLAQSAGKFVYQPAPGCGDLLSGFALASGVVGALYKRERTGQPSLVDVSLLANGIWGMSGSIAAGELYGMDTIPVREKHDPGNALVSGYRTKDDRYLFLTSIRHDEGFEDFAGRVGHPEWSTDARFVDHAARVAHHHDFVAAVDEVFAQRTLAEWQQALDGMAIPWSVVQTTGEAARDPQTVANDYVQDVVKDGGRALRLASTPVQFDETAPTLRPAPVPAQHTEEILLELGRSWDDISRLKATGAIS